MLKIKVAIVDVDEAYLNKLTSYFSSHYCDKLEVCGFSTKTAILEYLQTNRVDVLLVSDSFQIDVKAFPERIAFAYLCDSSAIDSINGKKVVRKYQKADMLYKEILSIYSENPSNVIGLRIDNEGETAILAFFPTSGGTGCSTIAASCCINLASRGKRVLYLNMEHYGNADLFFSGDGTQNFSDIIYSLKSKKGNLMLRMESAIKKDATGVYFFEPTKTVLDLLELTADDISKLLSEIRASKSYDYVVLDTGLYLRGPYAELLKHAHSLIFVLDDSSSSQAKFMRIYDALKTLEAHDRIALLNKLAIIYNKVQTNDIPVLQGEWVPHTLFAANMYAKMKPAQLIKQMANISGFENVK